MMRSCYSKFASTEAMIVSLVLLLPFGVAFTENGMRSNVFPKLEPQPSPVETNTLHIDVLTSSIAPGNKNNSSIEYNRVAFLGHPAHTVPSATAMTATATATKASTSGTATRTTTTLEKAPTRVATATTTAPALSPKERRKERQERIDRRRAMRQRRQQRIDSVGASSATSPDSHDAATADSADDVLTVDTMEDFQRIVLDEQSKIVVARFSAPWCKTCQRTESAFHQLANQVARTSTTTSTRTTTTTERDVMFVQVPVTPRNWKRGLHKSLGIRSFPLGRIYHPTEGMMEEMNLTKSQLPHFLERLQLHRHVNVAA